LQQRLPVVSVSNVAAFPGRRAWRLIERDSGPVPRAAAKSIRGGAFATAAAPQRGDDATRSFVAML
jgi:hypothetical protein